MDRVVEKLVKKKRNAKDTGMQLLIATPGIINVDFADVKTIMQDKGSALMGIGIATGENRATEAAKKAISSPLLETTIDGAHGILMNITGGAGFTLYEVQEAAAIVTDEADQEVNVIFGAVMNEELKDEIVVTVIATGFDETKKKSDHARPTQNARPTQETKQKTEQTTPDEPAFNEDDTLDIPTFLRNRNRRR